MDFEELFTFLHFILFLISYLFVQLSNGFCFVSFAQPFFVKGEDVMIAIVSLVT